ncbi:AraC family transcriptional regulator [Micromonospora sp. KC721]|uniref:AraC family transcriptional regulator n=1 Tax=Micromonospora sp. KC721 TaxID=2530380 RepID=UPI00104A0E8E|nr:AraC family transcriptional regulator [Micromonospora sp. KC721]TDB80568.1 AraC family transcriptional regulator [Micromonospora sp. KC721]
MYLRDGFPDQRLHVLPRLLAKQALQRKPTSRMLVTDAGYFPHAARHGRWRHAGAAETIVIMCADGSGWCEVAGARHDVGPNEVLIIPAAVSHQYYAAEAEPWSIWWLHVTGDDVPDLLSAIGLTVAAPTAPMTDPFRAFALAESICDELARDETAASLTAAAGAAWNLLAQLAAERDGRGVTREPIARVQDYLRAHLSASLNIRQLAELAGYSTSHFSARFRSLTGFSVTEYTKRLRMARARQLLVASALSIAEIAAAVGYHDPFYFSRHFTAVNGMSPREYRARDNGENRPRQPA